MNDLSELPHLERLFNDLRLGRHICPEDGLLYYSLRDQFGQYQRLFRALGFDLRSHDRGFYYFCSRNELGKEATQMAVFFFVFVDALGNEGLSIRDSLFDGEFRIDELPHFKLESHRQCLAEVDIQDEEELHKVISRMGRYGFAHLDGRGGFRFRSPAWRFIDLCYEAARSDREEGPEEEES